MWKLLFAITAIFGVVLGFWSMQSNDTAFTVAAIVVFLAYIGLKLILELIRKHIQADLADVMAGGFACYGYAHAPTTHTAQAVMLSLAVVVIAMDITGKYFARGYEDASLA